MKKTRNVVLAVVCIALLAGSVGTIWLFRQWLFVNPWEPFAVDNVVYTAKDSEGSILVLDDAGNRLVKIRDGYVVWSVKGSPETFSNGKRLATDGVGNIYVQSASVKGGTRLENESIVEYSPCRLFFNIVNSQSKSHSGIFNGVYFEKGNVVELTLGNESQRGGNIMVKNENTKKNKHLTPEDRKEIEGCLSKRMTFKAIAKLIGKDPTTISYEIKHHKAFRMRKPCSSVS